MREKRFALSLGLPEASTGDCARVTLVGQSAALVEGQHGVIELTESRAVSYTHLDVYKRQRRIRARRTS